MEILEFKEDFMFNCFHKGLRTNPYTLSPYDKIRTWQNLTVGGLSLGGKVSNTKKKKIPSVAEFSRFKKEGWNSRGGNGHSSVLQQFHQQT